MEETPDHLKITLSLASLDREFTGAVGPCIGTYYSVWWVHFSPVVGEAWVSLVAREMNGQIVFEVEYGNWCNYWWWCSWKVDVDIDFGSPAAITWTVPRQILPAGDVGDEVIDPYFWIAGLDAHESWFKNRVVVDRSQNPDDTSYTFSTPMAGAPTSPNPLRWESPAGDERRTESITGPPEPFPDVDIIATEFLESPTTFSVATTVQLVETTADPGSDYYLLSALGLPSGRVFTMGFVVNPEGQRRPFGDVCEDPYCLERRQFPVNLTVEPGAPGRYIVTVDRGEVDPVREGELMNLLYSEFQGTRKSYGQSLPEAAGLPWLPVSRTEDCLFDARPVWACDDVPYVLDYSGTAPPYWFHYDTEQRSASENVAGGRILLAAPGTTGPSPDVIDRGASAHYDVTFIEARGRTASTSQFKMGVAGYSNPEVPAGYDAILHAIAVQTADGIFTIAHLQHSTGEREAFCGPDTVVFPETKAPPTVRTPLQLWFPPFAAANRTYDSSGIHFWFIAPHECFGQVAGGPINVEGLSGGTYLVRDLPPTAPPSLQRIVVVDEVRDTEPFVLSPPAEPAGADAGFDFLALENFWDILGIIFAFSVAVVGAAVMKRRRSALKRFLHEIDEAIVLHRADPKALEEALLDIRPSTKEALMNGRLTEGQFVIISERLDSHLSRARMEDLSDAFGELPHRLLRSLEGLLRDGTMTSRDYRTFSSMLVDANLPSASVRRIRKKLQVWVQQDQV